MVQVRGGTEFVGSFLAHTLVLNCFENLETSFAIPTGVGLDSEM